jgi:hypothetical protein
MAAHQPVGTQQPGHPLAADPHATGDLELGMDPWGAVGATAVAVDAADLGQQPFIGALAGTGAAAVPVGEAGWGDATARQHHRTPTSARLASMNR